MTLPNKQTARNREAQKTSSGKRAKPEFIALFLLCLTISIFVSVRKTMEVMLHHDNHASDKHEHAHAVPVRQVGTEPLEHEHMFTATVKSCLPEQKKSCKLFVPENTTAQRVALVAPPGDMASVFFRLLEVVVGRAKRKIKVEIDLILTTHIPPYGYGKTHGWTRIIRMVPQPLLLGTVSTIQAALGIGGSMESITVEDIKAVLRQEIRYHCRLSHVAAHTALWSIDLESLIDMSLEDLIEQIQVFLDLEVEDILEEIEEKEGADEDDLVPPDNLESLFFAMTSYGASMLTHAQLSTQRSLLKEFDGVLLEEMRISSNLTAWPCESFWTVGDQAKDRLKLSPIVQKIAASMSPDCKAPFTSCFVKKDLCEAGGDGACKGK